MFSRPWVGQGVANSLASNFPRVLPKVVGNISSAALRSKSGFEVQVVIELSSFQVVMEYKFVCFVVVWWEPGQGQGLGQGQGCEVDHYYQGASG